MVQIEFSQGGPWLADGAPDGEVAVGAEGAPLGRGVAQVGAAEVAGDDGVGGVGVGDPGARGRGPLWPRGGQGCRAR